MTTPDPDELTRLDEIAADLQAIGFVISSIMAVIGPDNVPSTNDEIIRTAIDHIHAHRSHVWRTRFTDLLLQRIDHLRTEP